MQLQIINRKHLDLDKKKINPRLMDLENKFYSKILYLHDQMVEMKAKSKALFKQSYPRQRKTFPA